MSTSVKSTSSEWERPRLNTLFSEALNHNLVTIVAGEGYGKNRELTTFLKHKDSRILWLRLSKTDNIPAAFWSNLTCVLSKHNLELKNELMTIGFPDTMMKHHMFMQIFSREVYLGNRMMLVFDDFHLIKQKAVINFVISLADAKLEKLNIILLSNSRLEAGYTEGCEQDIAFISEEDLCFTLNETEEYFYKQDILIPHEEIRKIHACTKGNLQEIQLISESITRYGYCGNETIGNAKSMTFKWIEERIFCSYRPELQELFIAMSILDSFPIELLKKISGDMWIEFKAAIELNPFIYEHPYLDQYMVDRVLIEFLETKKKHLKKETITGIYLTAANWNLDQNMAFNSLAYYYNAKQYDKVWDIVFSCGMERHSKEEAEFLIDIIDRLPSKFSESNPLTSVTRAALLYNNYELDAAWEEADKVRKKLESRDVTTESMNLLGEVYILLGLISLTLRTQEFRSFFKMADSYLPEGSIIFGNNYKFIDMHNALIFASPAQGEVDIMVDALFEAMPYAVKVMHGCGCGYEYLAASEAAYYRCHMDRAVKYAKKAIEMAEEYDQGDIICGGYFLLIQTALAKGNYKIIKEYLKLLTGYGEKNVDFIDIAITGEAWVRFALGHPDKLMSLDLTNTPPISVGRDRLVILLSLIWNGEFNKSLAYMDKLEILYKERGLFISLLAIYIFRSVVYYLLKQYEESAKRLEKAFDLAEGNELYMPFIASGKNMINVINNAMQFEGLHIPNEWMETIAVKTHTYANHLDFLEKEFAKQ